MGIRNTSDTLYEVLASLIPEWCKFLFHGEGETKLEQAFCQFYWFGVSLLNNDQIYLNQLHYTCLHFHKKKHFETTFYYKAILATFFSGVVNDKHGLGYGAIQQHTKRFNICSLQ